MKLVCLNIWGGRVYKPLLEFLKTNSDVDIFCFQEVAQSEISTFSSGTKTDINNDLLKILKNYTAFLATPFLKGYDLKKMVDFDIAIGQAIFVKKGLKVLSSETIVVYGNKEFAVMGEIKREKKKYLEIPRNMQIITIKVNSKKVLIGNMHGFWMPISKKDSPHRIKQSKKVKKIFDLFTGPRILCGDFNLHPETKSMKILEQNLKNLIVEYGITTTRSRHHKRKEKFADYIMVSDEVGVNKFGTMNVNVSDHLPLMLDFSV